MQRQRLRFGQRQRQFLDAAPEGSGGQLPPMVAISISVSDVCTLVLVILAEPPVPPEPSEAALDNPGQALDPKRALTAMRDP